MPGSRYEQIEVITDLLVRLAPRRMLDVGIGNGLYGLLARQYVDGSGPFASGGMTLHGVEIFEGYLTPVQRTLYDDIFVGDAADIVPTLETGSYDVATALDVLEHLEDPRGERLLEELRRVSSNVIVTSPRGEFPQGAMFGNEHEEHVSKWPPSRLRRLGAALIVPSPFISIALFTRDDAFVRYYRRYLWLRRASALAPVGVVARLASVRSLRDFATRRSRPASP